MKIAAGLGKIEDFKALVSAGADEVFCGFVPNDWNERYGNHYPLNRREVFYYNVQICAFGEMEILQKMSQKYHVPVTVVFNALYYLREQYSIIAGYIKRLMKMGFCDYIIADIALITYLRSQHIDCRIQLSGEACELNVPAMELLEPLEISRYIFHRKNTFDSMQACMVAQRKKRNDINCEFEAFVLNEKCHYTGAFCNSLHCDELAHICHLSYRLAPFEKRLKTEMPEKDEKEWGDSYIPGQTGCGLCALYRLRKIGITHLKVVGRGRFIEEMTEDVRALKQALQILEQAEDEKQFQKEVIEQIFHGRCSADCYYDL